MIEEPQADISERGLRLVLITTGVLLATLMQTLDTTIVNVALPVIQGNLGATLDQSAWVITAYIIAAVIVIPLTPWLQSRFGLRQYYAVAVLGFTAASVCCGFSDTIGALIGWRVVQGLFGGGVIATGQAVLREVFPREHLGASQGIFALGAIVGPTLGPTLGGYLTDDLSWNACFFINVVPGLVAGCLILLLLHNPERAHRMRLDWTGLGMLALGLGSMQFVLDEGQRRDWFADTSIVIAAFAAAIGICSFVYWELFHAHEPIVDLRALRYRSVWAGSALSMAFGANLYGVIFLPQYVESILGYTAILSGMLLFYRAVIAAVAIVVAVKIVGTGRIDTRLLLVAGFAIVAFANIWLSHATTGISPFWALAEPVMVSGVGLALLWVPLSIAVLARVPIEVAPKATAFMNLALELGGSISTAALVAFLAHRAAFHQSILAGAATLANLPVREAVSHAGIATLYDAIVRQANTMAFADGSFVLGAMTLCCTPLVLFIQKGRDAGISAGDAAQP